MNLRSGVSVLVMNHNKEFLLVNLTSFKECYFAVPGGGIERGEELLDAAYREVEEELGIKKELLNFIGNAASSSVMISSKKIVRDGVSYDGMRRYFLGFIFLGTDNDIILSKDEVRHYVWSSYENLKDYLLFDHQNQLQDARDRISQIFNISL